MRPEERERIHAHAKRLATDAPPLTDEAKKVIAQLGRYAHLADAQRAETARPAGATRTSGRLRQRKAS